jgi:hypothetical protein
LTGSVAALGFLFGVGIFLVVLLALDTTLWILRSACQLLFSRSALADRESSPPSSPPGEGDHDGPSPEQPHTYRSSHGRLLSSPSPARSSADRESAAIVAPLTLAAIDPAPNLSAFSAGVELAIFIALFTISSLLALNWIVKTMRSSK